MLGQLVGEEADARIRVYARLAVWFPEHAIVRELLEARLSELRLIGGQEGRQLATAYILWIEAKRRVIEALPADRVARLRRHDEISSLRQLDVAERGMN